MKARLRLVNDIGDLHILATRSSGVNAILEKNISSRGVREND